MSNRLGKTWKPQLFKRELYSEILDHKFTIPVTARTLDLIDAAYGFDFYILQVTLWLLGVIKDAFSSGFLKLLGLPSDTEGRPKLQVGDGPEKGHVASPGAKRHRAVPRWPWEEREGLQEV